MMQLACVAASTDQGVQLHRDAWTINTHYWLNTRYAPKVLHFSAFHYVGRLIAAIENGLLNWSCNMHSAPSCVFGHVYVVGNGESHYSIHTPQMYQGLAHYKAA